MLPPPMRIVAASVSHHLPLFPSAVNPVFCNIPKVASAAAAICQSRSSFHQRRFSSSKPNSPKNRQNGPKALPAGAAPKGDAETGELKSAPEKRKRRSKVTEQAPDPFLDFPSVPSTQHISHEALGLSSFFSMHRPISITHTIPKETTEEAFAKIFTPDIHSNKPAEVISTLSKITDELDGRASVTVSPRDMTEDGGQEAHKIDFSHGDGSASSIYVVAKTQNGSLAQYLPFQPPPAPKPQTTENEVAEQSAPSEGTFELTPQRRVYNAMFTIEESMDADGQIHIVAHTPQIMSSRVASTSTRRAKYEDALRRREQLYAISTKKRRKLRMKKKKFKKKLKAGRKLREKLGR